MSTRTQGGSGQSPAGLTPPTADGSHGGFLSDVIVELGFATRDTVEQAVRAAQRPGTTVARVLVDTGAISEEQLARATAERYGIDYIDLEGFGVDPAAANLIKPTAAKRYQAVPVGFLGKGLLVAMADPADALGVNDIAVMTKLDVRPAVAARPALDGLLEALPLDERGADDRPAPADDVQPAEERPSAAVFCPEGTGAEAKPQEDAPAAPAADAEELEDLRARLAESETELDEARVRVREAKEGSADAEELRERLSELEAERDEERERARDTESELRRISADVEVRSAELDTLRKKLTDAETELVRVRAEADRHGAEAEAMRTRAESAEAAAASALRRADRSEREVEEAQREAADGRRRAAVALRLAVVLEAADARTEQARQALTELRQESEREREQWSVAERDLREQLSDEETRRGELEERLSEVEGSAFAAESAFEELRLAQHRMRGALRALADPDAPDTTDDE